MKYTKQNEMGRFSARWGCLVTALINACEYARAKKATEQELLMILGKLFVKESVYLCNYKNHAYIDRNWKEERGWKRKDSPEYFFYVRNRVDAINDIRKVMEIKNGSTQVTLIMLCGIRRYNIGSGTHFVLETPDEIVNPDENIDIKNLKYTIQGVAI